jgi:HlyD family type I secretion membrane fusion protein
MSDMRWDPDMMKAVEELQAPRREGRRGLIVAGLFFGVVLGWAALTPLDAGAVAQGVVAVSGSRQLVQHRSGGVVTRLPVSEGQVVKQGDVLVQISDPELVAVERGMTGEAVTLLAQRARLQSERDGRSIIAAPAEFASLPEGDQALAAEAMRGQRLLFSARRTSLYGQQDILNQRILQNRAQIGAFHEQITSNREQKRLIGDELDGLKGLSERGYVPINRVRAVERASAELQGNLGALQGEVAKTHESIGETRYQIVSLRKQLLENVATELRDVQLRLDELQPKLIAAREQLAHSLVRAPATGTVVGMTIHTVGGVAAPGATLMEIVPRDKALVIDAKTSPTDADDLTIGMETQVRFNSLQERNLPELHGKISKVSADSFEDERSGIRYFKIEVIVPLTELAKIKAVRGDIGIRAGLPADVLVPLRKRTALSYLTEPLTHMFWLAGREH